MSNVRSNTPPSDQKEKKEQLTPQQQKQKRYLTQEERLNKGWTNIRYTIAAAFEKAQAAARAAKNKNQPDFQSQVKELDKTVIHFLKYRIEYHRTISQIEAKLQGKAQEREALETYVRTQPRLGKRKRLETEDVSATTTDQATPGS
jgi:hypothetical protein